MAVRGLFGSTLSPRPSGELGDVVEPQTNIASGPARLELVLKPCFSEQSCYWRTWQLRGCGESHGVHEADAKER